LMAIAFMYPTKRLIHVFSTMPSTTMLKWFGTGWQDRGAGSGSTTFRPTARTFLRSSAAGVTSDLLTCRSAKCPVPLPIRRLGPARRWSCA
jgi:hypothetical protein